MVITARDVSWTYGHQTVLSRVDLAAGEGRVLGLIGPNGAGKTTLLRLLYGALRSSSGEVAVDGDLLPTLSPRERAKRIAVVVQESDGDAALVVADVVLLGRMPHLRTWQVPSERDHEIAMDALRRAGAEELANRGFAELSGGERQRVLIARALAQRATHLLLDEPTNNLDIRYQHELLGFIRDLGVTVIVVLHDLNLAARYCDEIALLSGARLVAVGPVSDVMRPETLEPVYGIGIERFERDGEIQLLFRPASRAHLSGDRR